MYIKTIVSVDGINTVDFSGSVNRFYWFHNIGTTTVYVSDRENAVAGEDGVAELSAGNTVCIETEKDRVYILGSGKVEIHNTRSKLCPFKSAPVSSGGGVIIPLDVVELGSYWAKDYGCDGFDPVNVNVPDKYDDGYLDGFESAMAYNSGEPDLSKTFYIYIGVQTLESTGEQYVQLNIFNSSDTSNVTKQMSWGYDSGKSFDKTITGIVWSDDKAGTITVYATSYNKAHTEKYTNVPHVFDRLTYDYGITKSNHSIGNTNLE